MFNCLNPGNRIGNLTIFLAKKYSTIQSYSYFSYRLNDYDKSNTFFGKLLKLCLSTAADYVSSFV